ncbi:MAG: hypothetical protein AAF828_08030 [Bacteroidota bacterium]
MKLLGLHYFFPPVQVVASRRLWYLYRRWEADFEEVDIITSQQAKERPTEDRYTHQWPLHYVAGRGIRERVTSSSSTTIETSRKRHKLYQFSVGARHAYPFLYFTDEGGPTYRREAFKKAVGIIESKGVTHLLSSYRPWVDHLVAAKLKKKYPQLHWSADFRDLPIDPVRKDVWWPTWQNNWAKRIIRSADEVLVVSQGQAAQMKALHTNVRVVYGGLEKLPVLTSPRTQQFIINYTGSIYPNLQQLAPLGEALQKWLCTPMSTASPSAGCPEEASTRVNLILTYAGKDGYHFEEWARRYGLLSHCIIDGVVSQKEAQQRQLTASVNLLLSWSAPNYYGVLTAKLYDYLTAGRPILALVNGPVDPELSGIIHTARAGLCTHQSARQAEDILHFLQRLYAQWEEHHGQLAWEMEANTLRYLL